MRSSSGTAGGTLFSSPESRLALCSQAGLWGEPHWKPCRLAHPPATSHRCPTKVSAAPARVPRPLVLCVPSSLRFQQLHVQMAPLDESRVDICLPVVESP